MTMQSPDFLSTSLDALHSFSTHLLSFLFHSLVERREALCSGLTALYKDILAHQYIFYHSNFLKYRLPYS